MADVPNTLTMENAMTTKTNRSDWMSDEVAESMMMIERSLAGKGYTLDGETIPDMMDWFIDDNDGDVGVPMDKIAGMAVGDECILGGGAGADFVLKRVK